MYIAFSLWKVRALRRIIRLCEATASCWEATLGGHPHTDKDRHRRWAEPTVARPGGHAGASHTAAWCNSWTSQARHTSLVSRDAGSEREKHVRDTIRQAGDGGRADGGENCDARHYDTCGDGVTNHQAPRHCRLAVTTVTSYQALWRYRLALMVVTSHQVNINMRVKWKQCGLCTSK